jgi:hypothetical protein
MLKAEDIIVHYVKNRDLVVEMIVNKDIVALKRVMQEVIQWFDIQSNFDYYAANLFCAQNLIQFIGKIPVLYRVEFVSKLLKHPGYEKIFKKTEHFDPVPKKLEKLSVKA